MGSDGNVVGSEVHYEREKIDLDSGVFLDHMSDVYGDESGVIGDRVDNLPTDADFQIAYADDEIQALEDVDEVQESDDSQPDEILNFDTNERELSEKEQAEQDDAK